MKIIIGDRRTGKTTALIKLCAKADAAGEVSYMVCHSRKEAHRVVQLARDMGSPIPFPLSINEFVRGIYNPYVKNFYLDNADYLLSTLAPGKVAAVTINVNASDGSYELTPLTERTSHSNLPS